jgi:hypothetical protein
MSIRRGFFRLWLVLSALWIASGVCLFWDHLSGKLRPDEIAAQASAHPPEDHILTTALDGARKRRIHAIEFVLLPPFGLLVFGCASIWVAGGFD